MSRMDDIDFLDNVDKRIKKSKIVDNSKVIEKYRKALVDIEQCAADNTDDRETIYKVFKLAQSALSFCG